MVIRVLALIVTSLHFILIMNRILPAAMNVQFNADFISCQEVLNYASKIMATVDILIYLITKYQLCLQHYGTRQQNANVSFISFSPFTSFFSVR